MNTSSTSNLIMRILSLYLKTSRIRIKRRYSLSYQQDLARFSRELSILENQNKENCDVPELFRKFNCSREAAEKILKDLKFTLNENNIRTEDKTT